VVGPGGQVTADRVVAWLWPGLVGVGWRFIHHVPDKFVAPVRRATAGVLAPTVEAIKAAGLPFHAELWLTGEGRCSQCHAGCTNCGQGGDEDPS
jgi:hypothetical protein